MIKIFQHSAYRNGYLFITAAWLYTLSFLFTNYFSASSSPEKVAKVIERYVTERDDEFNSLVRDSGLMRDILSTSFTDAKKDVTLEPFGFFVFGVNDRGNALQIYWNTNAMSVPESYWYKPDGSYPLICDNGYFELIKKTITRNGIKYMVFGMIPIYWDYKIETEEVKNGFVANDKFSKSYIVSDKQTGAPIFNSGAKRLFDVVKKDQASLDHPGTISILLRLAAVILLMIFVNALAADLALRNGFFSGFLVLTATVLFVRISAYLVPFPFNYRALNLFSPRVYASSQLHPSLGDLMINSVLLFWLVTFIKFNIRHIKNRDFFLKGKRKQIIAVLGLALMPSLTITMANFLTSLIKDSSIPFGVTYLFALNIYTVVSFFIICILMLVLFYSLQLLYSASVFLHGGIYWRIIILLSFALLFLTFQMADNRNTILNFVILGWLTVFYIFCNARREDVHISFYNSPWFMIWSVFLMASVAAFLIYQNSALELEKRQKIAEKLSITTDAATEKILSVSTAELESFFSDANFRRFYNEEDNRRLKSSIINSNFRGYLNNFNTKIYTYDFNNQPLYNDDSTSWHVIRTIVVNTGNSTTIPNLYYYENAPDKFSYIYEKTVYSPDSVKLGYVYLVIQPKTSKENNLSPQIFRELVNQRSAIPDEYAYAIYSNNHLVRSTSNHSFNDSIPEQQLPSEEFTYRKNGDYTELLYNAPGDAMIIVARKDNWFTEAVTFFAYLFGLFVILVLLQHFGQLVFKTRFKVEELKKVFRFNIRTQIQTIIVIVSIISFIVIAIATISFFVVKFNNSNEDMLQQSAQVIENEIEQLTNRNFVATDIQNLSNIDLDYELEQRIVEIAEAHNTNINFFDVAGNLQISSQQYIYDNAIVSRKMNPNAYFAMKYSHRTQLVQHERIAKSEYLNIYAPVKNEDGSTVAFVNIPYLNPKQELSLEISNFLITLINLNAIIFILAGAIAIWITRRITSSFTFIGNKMKAISFGDVNEEIEWKKNDELGELVSEYNKMVKKLAESAKALARSEREGAWREMAQQVAHEIKNPLTPMKLSIQYLQRAIDNNSPNVKTLSRQVADTLVEQIDQLSKIAGDFSQFANIANAYKEVFDLSTVLAPIVRLFSADEMVIIKWFKEDDQRYFIEADKIQMNRLFTNLIKNAIEAYPDHTQACVIIKQEIIDQEIVVSVQDKASGIPEKMQPKIFAPNFTTKSSGTGLGLAICKGIIEKANGNIWFETKEDEGSTFYISLPRIHK